MESKIEDQCKVDPCLLHWDNLVTRSEGNDTAKSLIECLLHGA